jgi:hypothetical protein
MNQYVSPAGQLFGLRNYSGQQHTYYSNLIFESIIGNTNHKYKAGASFYMMAIMKLICWMILKEMKLFRNFC